MQYQTVDQFDPVSLAIHYYFGDLGYENIPKIAADALEQGFDGRSLRRLAALQNPVNADVAESEVEAAFRELGVAAPISRNDAQLALAVECATGALSGKINVFDAATHIRIYICELKDTLPELRRIIDLSRKAKNAPEDQWPVLKRQIADALSELVTERKSSDSKLRLLA